MPGENVNYYKIYNELVARARTRGVGDEGHHIVPRCMGGTDDQDNVVMLTFKEHYIAHLLLDKLYPDIPGLAVARKLMAARGGHSRGFTAHRQRFARAASYLVRDGYAKRAGFKDYREQCSVILEMYLCGANTAEIAEEYGISRSNVQKTINAAAVMYDKISELSHERLDRNTRRGRNSRNAFTVEQETRRVNAVRAVDRTEYAARLKIERVGAGNPVYGKRWQHALVTCPHCEKTGGISSMKRWHMNNCKQRKENGNFD